MSAKLKPEAKSHCFDAIGVYTALFGNYDRIKPPAHGEGVDHILFTDQDIEAPGWTVRRVERPHPDPRYASRFYFSQSCLVMPDYGFTVMHGANAHLGSSPSILVKFMPKGVDIVALKHPRRDAYHEAEACISMKKDIREVIEAQMERYRAAGYPEGLGLTSCALLIRRNTPELGELETMWWQEIKHGSCRDQLSFDYCRWKLGVDIHYTKGHWKKYLGLNAHIKRKGKK